MKIRFLTGIFLLVLCSCASKKELWYLQNVEDSANQAILYSNAKIQPNDVLRITVSALIPASAVPYNTMPSQSGGGNVQLLQLEGYLVSKDLTINFPILGVLSVADKTTQEFAIYLKELLKNGNHLKDPTVDVRLVNAKVTVLGEVNNPGTYNFTEQNITLLQALGYAGDLTIYGKREDVLVMREEEGVRQVTHIDLTTSEWLNGPFNVIKPNDVIIVNPNSPKVTSSGYVGNVAILLSVVSIILTSVVLITN
jgi:polysaccharide export outer membrane protein